MLQSLPLHFQNPAFRGIGSGPPPAGQGTARLELGLTPAQNRVQLLKRASARGHSHNPDSTSRGRTQLLGAFTAGHLDTRKGPCRGERGLGWWAALFSSLSRRCAGWKRPRPSGGCRPPGRPRGSGYTTRLPCPHLVASGFARLQLDLPSGEGDFPMSSTLRGGLPATVTPRLEPGTQAGLPPAVPRDAGQFRANFCPRLRTVASAELPWLLFSRKFCI